MGLNTNSRRRKNSPGRTEWKSYKRWLNRIQPKSIQAQGQLFVGCCCEMEKKRKKVNVRIPWYSEKTRLPVDLNGSLKYITQRQQTCRSNRACSRCDCTETVGQDANLRCWQMWLWSTVFPLERGLWCCWHRCILVTESVPRIKRLRCNAAPTGCSLCELCPLRK